MPIPTAGLLEISLEQTYGGQQLFNVFHYWNSSNTEPVSFAALAADFDTKIVAPLASIQGTGLAYISIRVRTVYGVLPDLVITPTTANGILAGEASPSFVSAGIKLQGVTKETRPGQKRFAGLTESVIIGNALTSPYLTGLDTFAQQLLLPIVNATTNYDPVIFSLPTKTRLSDFVNQVDDYFVYPQVTSQMSRKPGR